MDSTFRPYVGTEPYIFVSYARKDKETVLPIVQAMSTAGYRIWYDEGIPWTEEWPDEIADRLADCAVCVAFHSSASIASRHCKAELHYAMSKGRHILSVYLEDDVRLPSGLEMYLSLVQAVKLSQFESIDAFVERLGQEATFKPCQKERVVPEKERVVDVADITLTKKKERSEADIAHTCINMGILMSDTGRMKEAERSYREAEEIFRRLAEIDIASYGPDLAETLNRRGTLLTRMGRMGEAEWCYWEALEIQRRLSRS